CPRSGDRMGLVSLATTADRRCSAERRALGAGETAGIASRVASTDTERRWSSSAGRPRRGRRAAWLDLADEMRILRTAGRLERAVRRGRNRAAPALPLRLADAACGGARR